MKNIAVIGGGASGITAAIAAARSGAGTVILEKEKRIGKKILATGNGRCNLTNMYACADRYHGEDAAFIAEAAEKYFNAGKTLGFFSELGLLCREEDDGKVYPYCGRASAVLDVLRFELERLGVSVLTDFNVKSVSKKSGVFTVIASDGRNVSADAVILAAGGKASPSLGSDGSGYAIAKALGHSVTALSPSLVQLKTSNTSVRSVKGLKINAALSIKGTPYTEAGELLFTDYGISGPPVFSISSRAKAGDVIEADIMPEYGYQEAAELLEAAKASYKPLDCWLTGILDRRIAMALMKECGIGPFSRDSASVSIRETRRMAAKIKAWEFPVTGTMPWANAQVTRGGVRTGEINPKTLESKKIGGLYICGELMDIDGDCGGFNLQWAWASGYTAGKNAAMQNI